MLRMRIKFTDRLHRLHERTLAKHSTMKTQEDEEKAMELWELQRQSMGKKQRRGGPRMPCPACSLHAPS